MGTAARTVLAPAGGGDARGDTKPGSRHGALTHLDRRVPLPEARRHRARDAVVPFPVIPRPSGRACVGACSSGNRVRVSI